ncbi:uncharacterized protein LOC126891374 [Diabrotica virgifera virgifera]|uniref:Uncharacterized protein n=1 Tax=Diabrotica virgifera virgifera TaxID=50390 RepID=A0ABM5L244_DIAVI|nr:uncharacterized protein LOC126891374 [Diabrotica virgifera virgifera]
MVSNWGLLIPNPFSELTWVVRKWAQDGHEVGLNKRKIDIKNSPAPAVCARDGGNKFSQSDFQKKVTKIFKLLHAHKHVLALELNLWKKLPKVPEQRAVRYDEGKGLLEGQDVASSSGVASCSSGAASYSSGAASSSSLPRQSDILRDISDCPSSTSVCTHHSRQFEMPAQISSDVVDESRENLHSSTIIEESSVVPSEDNGPLLGSELTNEPISSDDDGPFLGFEPMIEALSGCQCSAGSAVTAYVDSEASCSTTTSEASCSTTTSEAGCSTTTSGTMEPGASSSSEPVPKGNKKKRKRRTEFEMLLGSTVCFP